ncbi:hypothetical protein B0T16DRAFT_55540 [Cercophora newfieldiana]|uniref:Cell wall proline rich protein n=1 Tax=Cercophora newfieldiana TaxID=92897 RepID=A0AA39YTM9_9PEZI|nr:hypothetical protein B0T16DRAFT_55540 [Cercophora newfieldiana]
MAATIGPDMMVRASISDGFSNETARCFVAPTDASMSSPDSLLSSPQTSPKSSLPPPNPPFVFPARPSSSSAPSSFSRATGRRPRSAVDSHEPGLVITTDSDKPKLRSPALPAFSFNPGASLPSPQIVENAFLIPPKSPSAPESPRSIPVRPAGHRRGGSEFVGGNIRAGDAVTVLSSSPTKSESGMASPMLQPARPNRPRGHAHRRSAAISSHDLSSIILPSPNQNLRGSSAPTSPAILPDRGEFPVSKPAPTEQDSVVSSTPEMAGEKTSEEKPTPAAESEPIPRPQARNRVGFSDTLEFIPRPLSLVSNETSSTVTARPGHSVSGSISSVISLTNPDRELHSPLGFSSTRKLNESRPSTAGAILERTQTEEQEQPLPSPRRRGSIPFLGAIPPAGLTSAIAPATPSPTKTNKKWSFFGLDPFVAASPTRSRPVSVSSAESQKGTTAVVAPCPADQTCDSSAKQPADEAEFKPLTKKRSKKQKKVKTWAGSILSRKSKARHGKQKRRAPTPPPLPLSGVKSDGDNDEDSTEMSPDPEPSVPSFLVTDSTSDDVDDSWGSSSLPDEDTSYPMIDLDAALGPFNTPLPRNPEWEAAQRAGGLVKKQLHSAAGMSRFTGPGMHYHHRRAESAPEMAPFDAGRLGFPRFSSSSTMADVFEEDEEDDEQSSGPKSTGQSTPVGEMEKPLAVTASQKDTSLPDINTQKLSTVDGPASPAEAPNSEVAVGLTDSKPLVTPRMKFNHSSTSLHEDVIPEEPRWTSSSIITRTSMDSATPSPRHVLRARDLAPVDVSPLNLPTASLAPISPYSMTQSSAFPSPRSPMSYDAHRISTAPSSITEDNFQSLLMGEPGPEVRISVDDIPSLTSSNSTMTRESIFAQHSQARQPGPLSDQPRPASFTSSAFGRRRSSLASLSRLISSSHGERSKLSMEVSMDSEPEKKAKVSKTKRLSRLVQFWKTKEGETQ